MLWMDEAGCRLKLTNTDRRCDYVGIYQCAALITGYVLNSVSVVAVVVAVSSSSNTE